MPYYIVSSNSPYRELEAKGAEIVVKCRDCRYVEISKNEHFDYFGQLMEESNQYECSFLRNKWVDSFKAVQPTDFCAWGTPR